MTKTRRIVQFTLLATTLVAVFLVGANAEAWCPFGGVEALYTYFHEGNMICSLGVSNFFILGAVLVMTLLVRRAFCGYLCPIGTLSEWLSLAARRMGLKPRTVAPWLDRMLSLGKYAVLGAILWFTYRAGELLFRGFDPCYALISRHGPDITLWAYVSLAVLVAASLIVVMPFCRWLCPMAAVMNPLARFGLARIKRDPDSCTGCRACAKACPMAIPVDRLAQVTAARCLACMNCVEACPKVEQGTLGWGPPGAMARRWPQWALVLVLALTTGVAVAASYWMPFPSFVKSRPGAVPAQVAVVEMRIDDLTCRGRANLLYWFLDRDRSDLCYLPGWFKIEAWPGPGWSRVRISYDPAKADAHAVKQAITEPCFDVQGGWRPSPFRIQGYDPLGAVPPPTSGGTFPAKVRD
jgi:ferredoxin